MTFPVETRLVFGTQVKTWGSQCQGGRASPPAGWMRFIRLRFAFCLSFWVVSCIFLKPHSVWWTLVGTLLRLVIFPSPRRSLRRALTVDALNSVQLLPVIIFFGGCRENTWHRVVPMIIILTFYLVRCAGQRDRRGCLLW